MNLIDDYLSWLQARRLSPATVAIARTSLTNIVATMGRPLGELDRADLADWYAKRSAKVSARTLRTNVSAVKCFYRWAVAEDLVREDPTLRLLSPRVPTLLPRPISEERLADAIAQAEQRVRVILCLAAFAGLRAAEIASLEWSDVALDGDEPHLRVVGKGSRERIVDLSPDLAGVLVALPHRRGPVVRRADGATGHCTPARISNMGTEHLHCLGYPDTLHSLRHRMLTQVCRVAGLRIAQEVAGHASSSTTASYARVARRDSRAAVVKVGKVLG